MCILTDIENPFCSSEKGKRLQNLRSNHLQSSSSMLMQKNFRMGKTSLTQGTIASCKIMNVIGMILALLRAGLLPQESIEAVDEQNKSITFNFFDGEISKNYKTYKIHLQVVDKEEGGAVTIWTMEYEKQNEDIAPPYPYLDIVTAATKSIDAHHVLKA
ncbi:MLP-like protein 31 [Glycine max]|nr:MLP-like protein 31 [Glycine max]